MQNNIYLNEIKILKIRIFFTAVSLILFFFAIPLKAIENMDSLNKKILESKKQILQIKFEMDSLGIQEKIKRKVPLTKGEIQAYTQLLFKLDHISKNVLQLTKDQLKFLNKETLQQ